MLDDSADPNFCVFLSLITQAAGAPGTGDLVARSPDRHVLSPLALCLGDDAQAEVRASLITAFPIGAPRLDDIDGLQSLSGGQRDDLQRRLGAMIQALVEPGQN